MEAGQGMEYLALADAGCCPGICGGVDGGPCLLEQGIRLCRTAPQNGKVAADRLSPRTRGKGFQRIERGHGAGEFTGSHHGVHGLDHERFPLFGLRIQACSLRIGFCRRMPGPR